MNLQKPPLGIEWTRVQFGGATLPGYTANPIRGCLPILFSAPMVRAILAGIKTQTRWIVKPDSGWVKFYNGDKAAAFRAFQIDGGPSIWNCGVYKGTECIGSKWQCGDDELPQNYQVGDRLWVKERHQLYGHWRRNGKTKTGKQAWKFIVHHSKKVLFDNFEPHPKKRELLGYWTRPSIFMPRWASRITLEITQVRVQRLQEISEEDCRAEGVFIPVTDGAPIIRLTGNFRPCDYWPTPRWEEMKKRPDFIAQLLRAEYASLWESINGEGSWEANPWVWAITFKRL